MESVAWKRRDRIEDSGAPGTSSLVAPATPPCVLSALHAAPSLYAYVHAPAAHVPAGLWQAFGGVAQSALLQQKAAGMHAAPQIL